MSRRLLDYNPETQGAEGGLLILGVPAQLTQAPPLAEVAELELAHALLEATGQGELGALANRLLRCGASLAGRTLDPKVAQLLGWRLMRAGQSVRKLIAPSVGRSDPGDPSEAMERITGAELEGLSAEDQEFETARAFVRFAIEAARTAARAPSTMHPATVAATAARVAARRHAPGLDLVQPLPGFRARRAIRRQSFV